MQHKPQHTRPEEDSMSTTQSFTSAAKQTEIVEGIATLYTKGVERLAEAQKKILDVAQQHNAEAIDAWKKIGQGTPSAPGLFILIWLLRPSDSMQICKRAQLIWP